MRNTDFLWQQFSLCRFGLTLFTCSKTGDRMCSDNEINHSDSDLFHIQILAPKK